MLARRLLCVRYFQVNLAELYLRVVFRYFLVNNKFSAFSGATGIIIFD